MKTANFFWLLIAILSFNQEIIAQTPNIHIVSARTGALEYENRKDSTCIGYTDGYEIIYSNDYGLTSLNCIWTGWSAGISPVSNVNGYQIEYDILQAGHYQLTCTVYALNHTTNKIDTAVLHVNLVGLDCYNPTARFATDTVICTGTCIQYKNTSTTMEANLTKNYWTFVGGTPTADYTYNKINPSAVCYNTAGRYATKLVVTNFDYFKDSITRYITVKDPPVLTTATTQYKKIVYPDTLHLKACAPQAAHLQWQPVTGLSCTDCASPILSYPYESVYTCIAWDNEGCQDTCNYYLTIDYGRKQVYLPNTFTPNGDGKNDFFTLYSNDAVRIIKQFQVFDRYGELVFSAENIAPNDERKGWDGSFKGMSFTPDVFAYRITVEYADGTTETLVGDVTVVK